jgi:hypothetical protein
MQQLVDGSYMLIKIGSGFTILFMSSFRMDFYGGYRVVSSYQPWALLANLYSVTALHVIVV